MLYITLNLKDKKEKRPAESKNENMTTKPHSKTFQMQATIKNVKSVTLKPPTDSKIHSIETRDVIRSCRINSLSYQQNILKPIFDKEIPTLHRKDIDKVELHIDKASSNTSKSTTAKIAKKHSETGIKCTSFDEIPVKSLETSPLDFWAFGLLKRALGS
ncbi:RNase H domain-containing protein [Trichonephila clavipes]|nr:RNase H domain-containing protein [Trichonephila clavipes]